MKTADQLLADLTNAAISYGEALQSGTTNKVNKANAAAVEAFEALREQGEDRRVMDLLEFAHPAVRLVAARLSLRFDPERSKTVLRKISDGPKGPLAAMAYTYLTMWEDKFPGFYLSPEPAAKQSA